MVGPIDLSRSPTPVPPGLRAVSEDGSKDDEDKEQGGVTKEARGALTVGDQWDPTGKEWG